MVESHSSYIEFDSVISPLPTRYSNTLKQRGIILFPVLRHPFTCLRAVVPSLRLP